MPLLAVADDAGGTWPGRARAALLDLFGKRAGDGTGQDAGALLLGDLRDLFRDRGAVRLPSSVIAEALGAMEERPWPEWKGGKPMTTTQLARALAPFRVRPENMRENTGREGAGQNGAGYGRVVKGYTKDTLADAWARYLPAEPGTARAEDSPPGPNGGGSSRYAATTLKERGKAPDGAATVPRPCSGLDGEKSTQEQSCSGVAAPQGGAGAQAGAGVASDDTGAAGWSASL